MNLLCNSIKNRLWLKDIYERSNMVASPAAPATGERPTVGGGVVAETVFSLLLLLVVADTWLLLSKGRGRLCCHAGSLGAPVTGRTPGRLSEAEFNWTRALL